MSCSNRARLHRPSPLVFTGDRPGPRLSILSVLPATVYCPDDDEPSSPATPTDVSGLFGNGSASSSSSYSAHEISPPNTPVTEVYCGRKIKRKSSTANMRGDGTGFLRPNKPRQSKFATQTPSTPITPLSGFDTFCAESLAAPPSSVSDFQIPPFQPKLPRPSTAPEHQQIADDRLASSGSNAVLGIGMEYPGQLRRQKKFSNKVNDQIFGDWDVSDDDDETPSHDLELRPWMPLQIVRKSSAPAILSTAAAEQTPTLCSAPRLYSNTTSVAPSLNRKNSSESASTTSISEGVAEEEAQVLLLTQPMHRQSIVDVPGPPRRSPLCLGDHHPVYSESVVNITSSASTPRRVPFTLDNHPNIEILERSPSAPVVTSTSTVSFDTSEDYPVIFPDLPVDETEILNAIPTELVSDFLERDPEDSEYPFPRESQAYTIHHPSFQELSQTERLGEMMSPESPTMGFPSTYNSSSAHSSPSPSTTTGDLLVPSPASFRPNSRWSDYSIDDDAAKESWRTSVLTHLHLPNVGMDLKKAVAAAKGGIINRRRKVVVESSLVEEESLSIRDTPSPRNSTATDTDSIADTTPIAPLNLNHRSSTGSGSGIVGFKMGRIASPGSIRHGREASIRHGKENSTKASSTGKAATIRSAASSDEDLSDEEGKKSKGTLKGVFGKYVVRDAKKRKEEKRREELKKTIRVVGKDNWI